MTSGNKIFFFLRNSLLSIASLRNIFKRMLYYICGECLLNSLTLNSHQCSCETRYTPLLLFVCLLLLICVRFFLGWVVVCLLLLGLFLLLLFFSLLKLFMRVLTVFVPWLLIYCLFLLFSVVVVCLLLFFYFFYFVVVVFCNLIVVTLCISEPY